MILLIREVFDVTLLMKVLIKHTFKYKPEYQKRRKDCISWLFGAEDNITELITKVL